MNDITVNEELIGLNLEISTFEDEKEYKKFVNSCKRIIRGSIEYQEWVKYVKYTLGYDHCVLTNERVDEVTIDLHHHPFSLENIVRCVIETWMQDDRMFTSFDIAKHVMQLHYENKVGYVLLLKSLHEKFHNGFLKIPIELVNGDWKYLLSNYIIPDDVKEVVNKYTTITLQDVMREYGDKYIWTANHYPISEVDLNGRQSSDSY